MRGGPEMRLTCAVTTVNADTSVVLTQVDGDTQDDRSITTITIAMPVTNGWVVGERVEVRLGALSGSGQQGAV